jgi:hypothetical protein|tara:strand:- start:235 stop:414 length:180 start_codon:yes stop_codon:yes gene_type:complete
MKTITHTLFILGLLLTLHGCATPPSHQDDQEFSDMPWNTPQQWEGSRQMPGLSTPGRGF